MAARPLPDTLSHALKLLSGRERTTEGLRAALLQKGHPEAAVDAALASVLEQGYLDDAKLARRRAEAELSQPISLEKVIQKLVAKGVDEGLARGCVGEVAKAQGYDAAETAKAFLERKGVASRAQAERVLRQALFDEDVAEAVANRFPAELC